MHWGKRKVCVLWMLKGLLEVGYSTMAANQQLFLSLPLRQFIIVRHREVPTGLPFLLGTKGEFAPQKLGMILRSPALHQHPRMNSPRYTADSRLTDSLNQ